MQNIQNAMKHLDHLMSEQNQRITISFERFLRILSQKPEKIIRNVFSDIS